MTTTSPPAAPESACPDPEALAGLALGEGEGGERRALADHVAGCAACAADFRLLREMHREASRSTAAPRASRRMWLVSGAAAALAAVGLSTLLLREGGDRVRGTAAPVRPPDGAVLEAAPAELHWPSEAVARGYRVKLFRGDATLLWESGEIPGPPAALPPPVRDGIRPGGSWYWTVEASGPVQHRRLGPFWFQLRAR